RAAGFGESQPGDWHDERGPFQTMDEWRRTGRPWNTPSCAARRGTRSPEVERFADRWLAYFPDETVVVEMKQRRGGQQPGQDAAECLTRKPDRNEVQRSVNGDQSNIEA